MVSCPPTILGLENSAQQKRTQQLLGDIKSFSIMKKHYKAYCTGFPGAKELRIQLMEEAKNAADVERLVAVFLTHMSS